jgi:hypothetical protein
MSNIASITLLTIQLSFTSVFAQYPDVQLLLDSAANRLSGISSYSVEATFDVDIDFLNMPVKTARITYEAPDKLNIDADGLLLVPRVGMRPFLRRFNNDNFVPLYIGEEKLKGMDCHVVKLIPLKQKGQVVLATVWIRQHDFLVGRWETFTKRAGRIQMDLEYHGEVLPSMMIVKFEVSGMNIPLKYFGNEVELDKTLVKEGEELSGTITIRFNRYRINYQ